MTKKGKNEGEIPSILRRYMELDNIAPELNSQMLTDIASEVIENAQRDDESRYKWKEQYNEALKIARQITTGKNTPWQGAADVKYPLILSACIQYNARMLPEIVQGTSIVKIADMNPEADEMEEERNEVLANHMSWQMLEQVENWQFDTDKLMMILPLAGVIYRKTRFDSIEKKPAINLCLPSDIIIHNDVSSLETARRVTHILHLSPNDLWEKMRAGIYIEYPIEKLEQGNPEENEANDSTNAGYEVADTELHEIYEQHTFYDLDGDGYEEPYIITVHRKSSLVLRIVARFNEESFIFAKKTKKFVKIIPDQYFTDYHFMPAPDGTFHSMGFGQYLYPLNETVNTIINQLLDAGTLQNTGGGFIAKSLRMSKEELRFKLGEYKMVNVPNGTNLAQNIYPIPAPGPSPVLLQLLAELIKSAEELAAISDVMQGQTPAANTTATTVVNMIEQGTKVYSSMLNRLYYSFKKEFEKLFELNKRYLDVEENFNLNFQAQRITLEDYRQANVKIFPVADPNISSDAHRMAKAQALMQIIQSPGVDAEEILKRYIEALKIPHPEKILPEPDPNAPPPMQEQLAEAEIRAKNAGIADTVNKRYLEALKINVDEQKNLIEAAFKGGQVAAMKVDSIVKLAQADAVLGKQALEIAERQAEFLQQPISPGIGLGTEQQLAGMEAALGRQTGVFPTGQGYPSANQAAPSTPAPEEAQQASPEGPEGPPEGSPEEAQQSEPPDI